MPNHKYGVVGFSFAKSACEPNPCNQALAAGVEYAMVNHPDDVTVIVQWEINLQLQQDGYRPDLVVSSEDARAGYLDTRDVWNKAKVLLDKEGIKEVMIVAQPFLHLDVIKAMIRKDGYLVKDYKNPHHVGFYNNKENLQWWTKGPLRFLMYAVIVKLTGKNGFGEKRVNQ